VGDDRDVWRAIAATAAVALALASSGQATSRTALGGLGGVMPPNWTHAEINFTSGGVGHTLIVDRGRVVLVAPGSLTLREQDGTTVQIPVSPSTQVTVGGRPGSLAQVRRGAFAVAQRLDGGAAVRLQLRLPPRLR